MGARLRGIEHASGWTCVIIGQVCKAVPTSPMPSVHLMICSYHSVFPTDIPYFLLSSYFPIKNGEEIDYESEAPLMDYISEAEMHPAMKSLVAKYKGRKLCW